MRSELLMPKLGLTMTEAAMIEWMVAPGQNFQKGQPLFVIESEKAAVEVPADNDGILVEVCAKPGETVPVGAVIAWWQDGASEQMASAPVPPEAGLAETPVVAAIPAAAPVQPGASASPAHCRSTSTTGTRLIATPLAHRLAQQRGIDLSTVRGSGPRGRIRAADVPQTVAAPQGVASVTAMAVGAGELHKPSGIEATIAQRLVMAKQTIPHFYLSAEAEVSALIRLRTELNAAQAEVRFSLNDFLISAVGRALAEMPHLNRVWTDDGILTMSTTDVGMAVNTDRGLMAPVLRNVGSQSLTNVSRAARSAIERGKSGRLSAADMAGGAITVSNAGMHEVTAMTSIINPGQAMILGVGSVRELFRPDSQGQPELKREITLVLSADHRVLDGVAASKLFKCIRQYLEQPLKLLVN
jgi:pyruvate dehydrogenase E2 component (dihydrolipoamide acetyltransferase)